MTRSALDSFRLVEPDPSERVPVNPPTRIGPPSPSPPVPITVDTQPSHDCDRAGCFKIRDAALASLFYFARNIYCWQRPDNKNLIVEHLHGPICGRVEHPDNPKQGVLIPRGCLKTTILAEAYTIWCLINEPSDTILLASATEKLAMHTLSAIKACFERNELFRHLFPEVIPDDFSKVKWSETEVRIPRPLDVKEPSIMVIGVGGTVVGHHFRRNIYDDLINEKHRDSVTEMQKADDWLRYAVNLLEDPDRGPETLIGTHWGHDDIYARRKREGQFDFLTLDIFGAGGESIFPEKYSRDALTRMEVRLGPYNFSANMRNNPVDPSRQIFRPEWFPEIEYDETVAAFVRGARVYILVDPALSEKKDGSFTGYVIAAVGPDYATVVLQADKRRLQTGSLIDRIFDDALRFGDDVDLVIEMRSLAKFLKYPIEERMRQSGRFIRLIETPTPNVAKEERIRGSLVPPAANLRFKFVRGACGDLLQDARDFPFGDGKYDALDTLSFLPQVWREGEVYEPKVEDLNKNPWSMVAIMRELRERGAAGENQRFALHRRALMGVN